MPHSEDEHEVVKAKWKPSHRQEKKEDKKSDTHISH